MIAIGDKHAIRTRGFICFSAIFPKVYVYLRSFSSHVRSVYTHIYHDRSDDLGKLYIYREQIEKLSLSIQCYVEPWEYWGYYSNESKETLSKKCKNNPTNTH